MALTRNDDPAHIAAVAAMAEKRGCDWPGKPCGRGIPEFTCDAECLCETIVEHGSTGVLCEGCKHFEDDCICWYIAEQQHAEKAEAAGHDSCSDELCPYGCDYCGDEFEKPTRVCTACGSLTCEMEALFVGDEAEARGQDREAAVRPGPDRRTGAES